MANTSIPPTFPEASKFNRSNWVAWKGLVTIAINLRGAYGYLDGTILEPTQAPQNIPLPVSPTATTTTTTVPPETPWESAFPSPAEWRVCNAWALGLLVYNTTDPVGLGIDISGTAADVL
jgi:hypothetical protein